jgi:polysaccharide export outer membrane protein
MAMPTICRRALGVVVLRVALTTLPVTAWAQDPAAAPAAAASEAPARDPGYRIGPGDLLSIAVSNIKQFEQTVRVSNTGKIHVPFLGVLKVADLTPTELERSLADRLRSEGLVKDPWVGVAIQQYRAQPVYILGEVMDPGQYVIRDEMYLIDLITLSGGFNDVATPVGYLYRRRPEGEQPAAAAGTDVLGDDAIEIDFRALNEGKRPDLNLKLRGGDVLYVPQRRKQHFFVVGDVNKPGAYEMAGPATLLSSQAVSKAGGPSRTAKMSKGVLVRFDETGARQEIPVDFKAVLEGRKPEIPIKPNDIIFIPGSGAKNLAYGLLGAVPWAVEASVPK